MFNPLSLIGGYLISSLFTGNSRNSYLADREHTEQREDTAYQRGVKDMQAAGLNPYTIGANPSPSSSSSVGAQSVAADLQTLGYILDMQNLSLKNKKITNDLITSVLGSLK